MYAASREAARGIQLQQFLAEIDCPVPLRVHTDSNAARVVVTRRQRVKELWASSND